jgi:hypothetical protein
VRKLGETPEMVKQLTQYQAGFCVVQISVGVARASPLALGQ